MIWDLFLCVFQTLFYAKSELLFLYIVKHMWIQICQSRSSAEFLCLIKTEKLLQDILDAAGKSGRQDFGWNSER